MNNEPKPNGEYIWIGDLDSRVTGAIIFNLGKDIRTYSDLAKLNSNELLQAGLDPNEIAKIGRIASSHGVELDKDLNPP